MKEIKPICQEPLGERQKCVVYKIPCACQNILYVGETWRLFSAVATQFLPELFFALILSLSLALCVSPVTPLWHSMVCRARPPSSFPIRFSADRVFPLWRSSFVSLTLSDFVFVSFMSVVWQPFSKKVNHVLFNWLIAREKVENGVFKMKCYFMTTFSYLQKILSCYNFQCLSAIVSIYKTIVIIFTRMQIIKNLCLHMTGRVA